MSASRCIPGPRGRVSASSCPASGRDCPWETASPAKRPWRCRFPWARWSAAPWPPTSWRPWEAQDDRLGAGPPASGNPGSQAGPGDTGQHPGLRCHQAADLSGDAGTAAGAEVEARRERYLSTRTKMAHFPFQRTPEQFDFSFQPSIDERQVKELAALAFVAEATNILMLGPPGVGKTTWPSPWP